MKTYHVTISTEDKDVIGVHYVPADSPEQAAAAALANRAEAEAKALEMYPNTKPVPKGTKVTCKIIVESEI